MPEKEVGIKLALLIEQVVLPRWQYEMVARLQLIEHVQIVLIVRGHSGKPQPFIKRVLSNVLRLSSLLEKYVFGWQGDARKCADIRPLINNATILDRAMAVDGQQHFERSAVDLLIDLRSGVEQPDYPDYCYSSTTQQVWRHFYDAAGSAELLTAGIKEFCTGQPVLNSGIISECKAGESACLLWSGSGVDRPLLTQNIDQMLWKMVDFMPLLLRNHSDIDALAVLKASRGNYHKTHRSLKFPGRRQTSTESDAVTLSGPAADFYLPALFKLFQRSLSQFGAKILSRLPWNTVQEQWVLLLGRKATLTSANDIRAISDFKKIIPPADRFWADPFLVSWLGQDYVFFEELIYREGKGTLACMALHAVDVSAESDQSNQSVVILEKPYHLSYPFTFQYQGALYMMPESAENQTLDVYRCEQFPYQWTWVKTLMRDIEAYDATLYEDEQGEWWLFVCMRHHEYASTNELLYLFSASSPLSDDWAAHPANPIVTDAATARPAGHLLHLDGKLYRPSQNCAGSYGRGLNLNEIITLNHQEYREQTSSRIIPAGRSALDGIHTLNCLKDRVVSDGIFLRK
ncbi:MAG: Unknown protein [uncultured Thiotrichaceae bacterium]|uniref:Glucosamine inositolphosphorylceramide transferase 1 N-terminal domain-containing protein n=1 Tax=uncultured Thiotrichaceae bacterium TaxID=298394 RepID=A0A6S6SK51_9GAMM|nr:MAG: Unknown protein [uncultured Thiotrichaceae bacterium]